jgi:hypothetical protein
MAQILGFWWVFRNPLDIIDLGRWRYRRDYQIIAMMLYDGDLDGIV